MKIAVYNPYKGRFLNRLLEDLVSRGHEVRDDRYYDPELAEWADALFFFTVDNNIKSATNPSQAILDDKNNYFPWDLHDMDLTGKKVIVMPIDIEVWFGHHHGVAWDVVTDIIYPAEHIKEMVDPIIPEHVKRHNIKLGVDMDKFDFVDKPMGKKIAWVCEKWPTKGIDLALQLMAILPKDYELHTIGGWNERHAWEKAYQEDFIKHNDIKFFDYDFVPDQNEWLADKDFILSCSKKEVFGYSIAEGMSKGLVPVIHRFYGCDDIWEENVWSCVDEAYEIIVNQVHDRKHYRESLIKYGYDHNYFTNRMESVLRD